MLTCTTSGYVNDSIFDELMKRSTRFLLGESKEKKLLPFLYMIDDIDKWNNINELRKANPNLGVSVPVDYMLEEIAIAEGSLSKRTEFLCKYACIKQNSSQALLPAEVVKSVAWGCLLVLVTLPAAASDRHRRRLGTAVGTRLSSRAGLCPQCRGLGTRLAF